MLQFFSSRSANAAFRRCAARSGATWDGRGTNFALFSANAEKVELCLFDSHGRREIERIALPERTEDVWHGYPTTSPPDSSTAIAFMVPMTRARLALQPSQAAARSLCQAARGRLVWSDAHFGYRAGSARADLSFDRRDNARGMPKGVVVDEAFTWGEERRPAIPWEDTIIYEAHVKGLTQLREDVPPAWRGTFRGLAAPAVIDHLKQLGVTALELLPIHAFVDDRHLVERGLSNYWGYNTLASRRSALRCGHAARRFARPFRGCTMPASRSSSTWSTITPPKAITSARR